MFKLEKKSFWIIGLCTATIAFILLFAGIRVIASVEPGIGNIMAYMIFSLLVGGVAASFVYFRLKTALLCYLTGLVLGFFFMYKAFLSDMSGWGDLIGIMSLLTWTVIGLAAGILSQLAYYLYKKFRKR